MTTDGSADAVLRLFVAIELPDAWKEALAAYQEGLQRRLDGSGGSLRVRFVRPEGIHLTLKFLGETGSDRLATVEAALALAVPAPPRFRISVGCVGSFSDRRAPRIIWAGLEGETGALSLLAERVETRLAAAGFQREGRAFQPHLTLARLPQALTAAQRETAARVSAEVALPRTPPLIVQQVSLMRSQLGPGGARYECLGRLPASPDFHLQERPADV